MAPASQVIQWVSVSARKDTLATTVVKPSPIALRIVREKEFVFQELVLVPTGGRALLVTLL
jgi:hypothetical protein